MCARHARVGCWLLGKDFDLAFLGPTRIHCLPLAAASNAATPGNADPVHLCFFSFFIPPKPPLDQKCRTVDWPALSV